MVIRSTLVLAVLATAAGVFAAGPATPPATAPATAPSTAPAFASDKEKVGYAIGLQIGETLKDVEFDPATLAAGIHDGSTDARQLMTDKEIQDTMNALRDRMLAKQQQTGDQFLAENAKKDGVKTTASGLQYKVIKAGTGKMPKATDTVSVNYRGTLISGKEFDASHGEPVSFGVNQVIPGWTEALQLMKEGDKWQLFIPSKLAYGERGAGGDIGPNETLIFEVELVAVK